MKSLATQFQDLQWVIDRATVQFKREPNRRISSLFRDLRNNPHFSLFGDYGILWAIAKAMDVLGTKRVREQFGYAAKQSSEFRVLQKREKMLWLDAMTGVV